MEFNSKYHIWVLSWWRHSDIIYYKH